LSVDPDPRWRDIFIHEYKIYGHSDKRHLAAKQNPEEIVLEIREDDDLQTHCVIVKEVIDATNKEVDRRNIEIIAQETKQKQEDLKRKETINRLKEQADKIKL
jgi:hypothetical protein